MNPTTPSKQTMTSRFHGRVKAFFLIATLDTLPSWARLARAAQTMLLPTAMSISELATCGTDPRAIMRKAVTGEILEYERRTDEQGRHRAYDITNLYETPLICEEGLVVFKRYYDINREALRREGQRAINDYLAKNSGDRSRGAPRKRNRNTGRQSGGGGYRPRSRSRSRSQSRRYESAHQYEAGDTGYRDAVRDGPQEVMKLTTSTKKENSAKVSIMKLVE